MFYSRGRTRLLTAPPPAAQPIDPQARKLAELVLLREFIINPCSSIILAISALAVLIAPLQLPLIPTRSTSFHWTPIERILSSLHMLWKRFKL